MVLAALEVPVPPATETEALAAHRLLALQFLPPAGAEARVQPPTAKALAVAVAVALVVISMQMVAKGLLALILALTGSAELAEPVDQAVDPAGALRPGYLRLANHQAVAAVAADQTTAAQ